MNICIDGELDGQTIKKDGRLLKASDIETQVSQLSTTSRFLIVTTSITNSGCLLDQTCMKCQKKY